MAYRVNSAVVALRRALNLSDVPNPSGARTNLGVGSGGSGGTDTGAVHYTAESPTSGQQTQARTNLGLGAAATHAATDFDTAGAAAAAQAAAQGSSLQKTSNLSDVASASTARTNLGLGDAATHPASDFLNATQRGAANGVAGLDSTGAVPRAQLPNTALRVRPRVGDLLAPSHMTAVASTAIVLANNQQMHAYPLDIPFADTYDGFYVWQTAAAVGGTGLSYALGLYYDAATDDGPDFTRDPIATATMAPATSAPSTATAMAFGTPVALAAGRYWIIGLYQHTTPPAPYPSFSCINGAATMLPMLNGTAGFSPSRAYIIGAQTALPTAASHPSSALSLTASAVTPVACLHRSA